MIEEQTIKFRKELETLRIAWKSASLGNKKRIEERARILKSALSVFDKIRKKL